MMQHFSMYSFVAGLMLGVLLAGAWFLGDGVSAYIPGQTASRLATSTENLLRASGAISVADQPAGESVAIESVTVPPPGVWVAVREVIAGDLGNVLGAARVSGPRSSFAVPLLRPTESGRSYAVQLYRDDSGGAFSPATNSVYVDFDTGARVVTYFNTTN